MIACKYDHVIFADRSGITAFFKVIEMSKLVFVGNIAYTRNLDKMLVIADEVSVRLATINGSSLIVNNLEDLQKVAERHNAIVNSVQKIRACELIVWHINGKAMLARCTITNRFVSLSNAQQALNIVLSDSSLYNEAKRYAQLHADALRYNADDCRSIIERNSVHIKHAYLQRLSAEYRHCIKQLSELTWAL